MRRSDELPLGSFNDLQGYIYYASTSLVYISRVAVLDFLNSLNLQFCEIIKSNKKQIKVLGNKKVEVK